MPDAIERTEQALDHSNRVHDDSKPTPDRDDVSLLAMPKPEAAKRILKDWDQSWKEIQRFAEQWKVNRARSQGYTGVALIKKQDKSEAYIPYNAKKNVGGLNKAARLRRRLRATLFADPPMAEATPSRDEDEARDEAEVSTRILQDLCSEGNLAFNLHAGDAFDLGGDYGSGFLRFWVDQTGGGWRPMQIEASPQAIDPQDPFPVDPTTGQPIPCDPILRYVSEDGQFVETPADAAKQWLPKIKDEVLTGKQVRFLPFNVRDLWEADGVLVGTAVPLGQLKDMFPELQKWPKERLRKLIESRPQHFKDILPAGRKDAAPGDNQNDAMVFVCTRYHTQSTLYPKGAYLIAAGADEILHRSVWYDEQHGEPLDIPLTQFKHLTEEDNPYGKGSMEDLGPGNELRGAMLGAELEHLDRFANRRVFVPMTSTLQPHQLQSPTGTPIPILPGGEPKYEEIPDFPLIVEKMLAFVSADMDDESGLQQSGQGMNPPGVKSGLHAQVILEQVNQALSDLKQNTERALIRGWRIMLQLVRAYYTTPQQIRWFGDDGRYKQQEWTGADLGSTKDVRIQKGSFTQLSPIAKADLANNYVQAGLLTQQDLSHVVEGNIGGLFGLQDNPHRQRVRRQIAEWNDGPPEDWQPTQEVDPQTGQPVPDPVLGKLFAPVPADDEPGVAMLRTYELGRACASTKFFRWRPEWQQGLAQAYTQARQAAQIMDAKQIEAMQKELEDTKGKLQKAEAAPKLSLSTKTAELDQAQTQSALAQFGLQVPAAPDTAEADPERQMAHERELKAYELATSTEHAKIKADTEIQKARIQSVAKQQTEAHARKHAADMVGEMGKALKGQKIEPKDLAAPIVKAIEQIPKAPEPEAIAKAMLALSPPAKSGGKRRIKLVRDKKGKLAGAEVEDD